MKLKNTSEPKLIINRDVPLKKVIGGGVIIFSLAATFVTIDKLGPEMLDSDEYGFYSTHYLENLNQINQKDYDLRFDEIYRNVTFSYNNNTYSGSSIYIISYDDGKAHLVDSNNRNIDLLTNESIKAKKTKAIPFKESSVFYQLYVAGIIKDEDVILSPNYLNIIANWDGEKHYQTVDLVAEQKTKLEYREKYGGK
ncbi:MAG: hypothetical protein IKE63_04815 [Bacilli bacterium]|nr:hypothetical protein [Bacilli bacterium]